MGRIAITRETIKAQTVTAMKKMGTFAPEYEPIIEIYAGLREQYYRLLAEYQDGKTYRYATPTADGGESITTCYTSTVSIPANCDNPEAAWEALKYICFERADLFAGVKAMNPGYLLKTDEEKEEFYNIIFEEKPGLDYDMAMSVMAQDRTLVSKDCTVSQGQTEITDLMNEVMSLVFTGEMGVDEALEKLKTDGDAAIAAALE